MIRPNEPYAMPDAASAPLLNPIRSDRWKACRAIKAVPITLRAQLGIEAKGEVRIVHADASLEMRGLEAELHFRDTGDCRLPGGTGVAVARLLNPGECFVPRETATEVPSSAGELLGVDLRDGELEPLGKVVALPPRTEGLANVDTTLDLLAAIGLTFTWVEPEPTTGPEILLGGEIRFLRGVVGRLILRSGSRRRRSSHLDVRDITFLKPGQVIHFPEQFIPIQGHGRDLARIRYRSADATGRGAPAP